MHAPCGQKSVYLFSEALEIAILGGFEALDVKMEARPSEVLLQERGMGCVQRVEHRRNFPVKECFFASSSHKRFSAIGRYAWPSARLPAAIFGGMAFTATPSAVGMITKASCGKPSSGASRHLLPQAGEGNRVSSG